MANKVVVAPPMPVRSPTFGALAIGALFAYECRVSDENIYMKVMHDGDGLPFAILLKTGIAYMLSSDKCVFPIPDGHQVTIMREP